MDTSIKDTDFDKPTDAMHKLLLAEEAEAMADNSLRSHAADCLAKINGDAIDTADAPYEPPDRDKPISIAHRHNEASRSALWRLRCFVDPSLRRPSSYVGYLTRDEVESAIRTLSI